MRLILFANPRSGGETDPASIAGRLRDAGADVEVHPLDDAGSADLGGFDRVVVAGGDGSIGPVAAAAEKAELPLAVIPTGTANDFARAMDLPRDPDQACALAARAEARETAIELLRAGDRPFLNAASAGLAPVAARRAEDLKPRLGALAYAVGALRAGLSAKPLRISAQVDGAEVFEGRAWQVVVAGTGAFGGGSATGRTASDDGLIDLAIVPSGSRAGLVRRAAAMRMGRLAAQRDVAHHRGAEVTLTTAAGTPFNIDGELCHPGSPARFTATRDAVRVVVAS